MEFNLPADKNLSTRMLGWLRHFPSEFQTVEVTVYAGQPPDEVIGHRVWNASKTEDCAEVVKAIVEYSHEFPPGTKVTMKLGV